MAGGQVSCPASCVAADALDLCAHWAEPSTSLPDRLGVGGAPASATLARMGIPTSQQKAPAHLQLVQHCAACTSALCCHGSLLWLAPP